MIKYMGDIMKLNQILEGVKYNCIQGNLDVDIKSISQDSRSIAKDSLFFAVVGEKFDGHNFISNAVNSGAIAIVGQNVANLAVDVKLSDNVVLIEVINQQKAISRIAANFYNHPSEELVMVGVTGTNGKTSVCKMLADCLEALSISSGIIGTIENRWGNHIIKSTLTTPQPISLNQILSDMKDDNVTHCVMEVSSHALDLDRTADIDYDYAVFTNLTEDHLDYHKDFESYFMAKSKLFNQASKGRVICADDEYGKRLYDICINKNDGIQTWRYGFDNSFEIYAEDIVYCKENTRFCMVTPFGKAKIEVPLLGKIAVYNTMAALSVVVMMQGSIKSVQKSSSNISAVSGRMEKVGNVFVDYSHTPDALKNALNIVSEMTDGRVIVVFGCGGNRDALKRPIMGKIASENAHRVFVTSDNPRNEDPKAIIDDIMKGIENTANTSVVVDRSEAIKQAIMESEENDLVLIAGKGHETYQEINGIRRAFDDRIVARKILDMKKEK